MDVKIEQSWKNALAGEFEKPYFAELVRFLHGEKAAGKVIYPPGSQIFRAFELTPVDQVKVVILGQDPYHGPGQAMGLSFSVPDGVPAPPSLRNIFQEVETDLGIRMSGRPNLEKWARQGVLLLNAVLTVQAGLLFFFPKSGHKFRKNFPIRKIINIKTCQIIKHLTHFQSLARRLTI